MDEKAKTEIPLVKGEVIQIDPSVEMFGACIAVVSEPKSFGCQCYVQIPGQGAAFFRPRFEQFIRLGVTVKWELQ